MLEPLRIAVLGAGGRLGRAVLHAVMDDERCELTGGVVRAGSGLEGIDLGELAGLRGIGVFAMVGLEDAASGADVVIDAGAPELTAIAARRFADRGGPALVTGVTGLNAEQDAALRDAARSLPVLAARNFSIGAALTEALVRQAAAALPESGWDVEIEETHHRYKADAPSGTALMLGEAAAAARGRRLDAAAIRGRDGVTGPRPPGGIGFSSTRGGGVIGEHAVRFLSEMEEITIIHRAHDRRVFAQGALAAALWIRGRPAGLYTMADVIGGA